MNLCVCCRKPLLANHEGRLQYYEIYTGDVDTKRRCGCSASDFRCFKVVRQISIRKLPGTLWQLLILNRKEDSRWTTTWRAEETGSQSLCLFYLLLLLSLVLILLASDAVISREFDSFVASPAFVYNMTSNCGLMEVLKRPVKVFLTNKSVFWLWNTNTESLQSSCEKSKG